MRFVAVLLRALLSLFKENHLISFPPTFLLPLFNLPIHACREGVMTK